MNQTRLKLQTAERQIAQFLSYRDFDSVFASFQFAFCAN
jgi:hypothetical protein